MQEKSFVYVNLKHFAFCKVYNSDLRGETMFKGDRLKSLRKKKGLTQTDLGDMMGLDKSTICCYEKGTRQPPLENIIDFMQIFAVTADYLLGSDHLIKTVINPKYTVKSMTEEEVIFIDELRKDKMIYDILLENPKRGADIVKKHLS